MSNILIKNATLVLMTGADKIIKNGEIAISDGVIVSVGTTGSAGTEFKPDKTIDAKGKVALPGFINCHTHAAMTLLRSYADDMPLMEWLNEKIWPIEDRLTGEDVYWGTFLSVLEMIKSGTTTFLDMYFFMEDTARAVEDSGIRAVLSRGIVAINPAGLDENKELVQNWQGAAGGRITTMFGPHAPYTCPPDFLEKVIAAADEYNSGLHIHVAESIPEVESIKKEYGKTPVEHLNDLGVFDRPTVAAHCVHLTDNDIEILRAKGVGVAHNPESNMKLASGIAPVPKLLKAGVSVGLGTDGASSNNNLDLLEEMRAAAYLHKVNTMDPTVIPAYQALEMATVNGAHVLRLNNQIGTLETGKKADIILIDFEQPHLYPQYDIVANLVYSAHSADVDTVIIDGRVILEGRKFTTLDEEKIMSEAQRCAKRLTGFNQE